MSINYSGTAFPVEVAVQGAGNSHPASGSNSPARPAGKAKRRIRLLIVDDHPVMRKGLRAYLARQPNFQIVGEAADGYEATLKARELLPDIVLMDSNMPRMDGPTATEVLRKTLPQVKVLILILQNRMEYVARVMQSGACGCVLKDAWPEELVNAIELIAAGEVFFSPDVAHVALKEFVRKAREAPMLLRLTPREQEVLRGVAEGWSNKEIANHLVIGIRTVESHRRSIIRKLEIHSVAGLTKFAISNGLVTLPEPGMGLEHPSGAHSATSAAGSLGRPALAG